MATELQNKISNMMLNLQQKLMKKTESVCKVQSMEQSIRQYQAQAQQDLRKKN